MNSLLWKQWRESKGSLALFAIWMVLAACYAIAYELGHGYHAIVGSFSGLASFYTLFAAISLAMRAAHGERADGSRRFTAALPIPARRDASIRIAFAVSTLAIPIVIAACVIAAALVSGIVTQTMPRDGAVYVSMPQRAMATLPVALEQLASVACVAILGGSQSLLFASWLGCRLRSQSQVGMLGAVLALGFLVAGGMFWMPGGTSMETFVCGVLLPQSIVVHWGYGDASGSYTDHELVFRHWLAMALSLPWLALVGWLFIRQYSVTSSLSTSKVNCWRLPHLPPAFSRFPVRFSGRLSAMIWLELRQTLPLAFFGLLLAALITLAEVMSYYRGAESFASLFLGSLPHSTFFVAILWAVVVGSSLYSLDLQDDVGEFWRSRPISPWMWFLMKYMVGLLAVLVVLDGVTILVTWNAPRTDPTTGMSLAYVACFPALHALMYSLAVLGTCATRKPVIGGMAAILAYTLLTIAVTAFPATNELEPVSVYNALLASERAGQIDLRLHGYPWVFGLVGLSIAICSLMAYFFARPLQQSTGIFARAN